MFNPRPVDRQMPIGHGHACIVIDDALLAPERLPAFAEAYREDFQPAPAAVFPGLHLPMPEDFTALLHDVGNLAVPASILAKPAPLTETELAIMRTHVDEGCQLLAEIDFGAPIADIIYQSHERYDGSGYPRGLKGEAIPVSGRIVSVVDAYDAIVGNRAYHAGSSHEEAVQAITAGGGSHFDPEVVAAFLAVHEEIRRVEAAQGGTVP